MSIKIDKAWDGLVPGQRTTDEEGNVWLTNDVITQSRDLPILDIPMEHLYIRYKIGNMELREFVQHMKQILEADLNHPIILDECGCVLDGRHRIARTLLDGLDTIKAKRFIKELKPSFNENDK